jgi:S-methylmethionine-dependent homocysteine/selenocysteine methylase
MGISRQQLPQLEDKICITDGGMETDLVFHHQLDLPEFAAYDLLRHQQGYETLFNYYKTYAELAQRYQLGLILETVTWRANADWGAKIGDSPQDLEKFNLQSVNLVEHIREEYGDEKTPIVISGCLGPRGDGYTPSQRMTVPEAQAYHSAQIATFAQSNVDMIAALTLNYVEEAIGITLAAQEHGLPVCISFTLETDGKLPTDEPLEQAIHAVDQATNHGPAYYMINCAHPTHFSHLFATQESWLNRVKGLRGNASCLSHAELNESETLDEGNPTQFGAELVDLKSLSPDITVLGGCCGTDYRHIEAICKNLVLT